MPCLLVIDDDPAIVKLVARIFRADGLSVSGAHDGASGLESVAHAPPDAVLLDMDLPDMTGLAVLASLARSTPSLPVIMATADRELKTAIHATRLGAFDYLTKPLDSEELVSVVRRALEASALRREVEDLRLRVGDGGDLSTQMGPSVAAREVVDHVRMVAPSLFTVLVLGETGTGKELVARAIHRESDRRGGAFVALDCGAIPEPLLESELFGHRKGAFTGADRSKSGRFQLAEGGTLFLDEIGNLPLSLQAKLLRVLESKELVSVGSERPSTLDVRFVAATNDDLEARVAAGLFRSDLYFRIAQYTITIPPLRDRPGDISYLADRFIQEASVELRRPVHSLLPEAIECLEQQQWPGNVRELRNVVRQAVLRSKDLVIRKADFRSLLKEKEKPAPVPGAGLRAPRNASLKDIVTAAESDGICRALADANGNKSQAARALQTDYKTLHLKIKKLGIRAHDFVK